MSGSESSDPTLPGCPITNFAQILTAPEAYPFLSPPPGPGELGRLGDYRVLRLLGVGGMGYVFEAEERTLRRRVALKVLRSDLAKDPLSRERFIREARAAAAINSDHIVTIYQVVDAEVPYLSMQFLEGESLQARIEKQPPITLRSALEIARQTAEGLADAHAMGFTHRDIKPANLWLERKDSGKDESAKTEQTPSSPELPSSSSTHPSGMPFRVKVLDFGLACRPGTETSLTSTGFIVGTPNYMSPEQASGIAVDGRSDLFGLGCVLYMVLAGELPFPGKSVMAVMMSLANRNPPPVNQKNPGIPQAVADLVARLLEKDPAHRPQSARELIVALTALIDGVSGTIPLPVSSGRNPTQEPSDGETLLRSTGDTSLPNQSVPQPATVPGLLLDPATVPLAPLPPRPHRRRWLALMAFGLAGFGALAAVIMYLVFRSEPAVAVNHEPIVVGILHSQTGTMALSESPVIDATDLAIDEINAAGGVLGRPIKALVVDGKSNPDEFGRLAEKLIEEDRVAAIFGCWTSASRRAVRDVLQRHDDGLLFYPVQYEGLCGSPRIVYLGPGPNQQLIPAADFLTRSVQAGGQGKKRLYLVGSDYVFPRVAHEIIRDQVKLHEKDGVKIVGEWFLPLGSDKVGPAVADIVRQKPDAIVNTINGSTNVHFFRELREAGITPDKVPTLSLSITENEVMGLNPPTLAGDYLAASYFQTIDREQSRDFLHKLRARAGQSAVATDMMAAAYSGVHIWAKAVEKAGTTDPTAVRDAVRGMVYEGVRGRITIDPENLNAWLPALIGKIRADGLIDLVPGAGSTTPIRPVPYPPTRSEKEWDQYLQALRFKWEGKWQPPDQK
jgi:urea transport system substrate-binding protein